ncbi:MAG: hypothetical protein ACLP07_00115 [Terracidiphilus sp.]
MKDFRTSLFNPALVAFLVVLSIPNAFAAAPSPSFTITATNVTMSSTFATGSGSASFTLTSVNGYAGTVGVNCANLNLPGGVNTPICDFGGPAFPASYTLAANQVVTDNILFQNSNPPCTNGVCPVSLPRRSHHGLPQSLALAGALLVGFGFRRRAVRWLVLALFAVGSLAGLVGINACGGNKSVVTPGTYVYTIMAKDMNTNASVTTTVNVTVP